MKRTRRAFMVESAGAAAGVMLARRANANSANEGLGIAFIGCGNRGNAHVGSFLKHREGLNLHCPVLCDVWQVNLQSTAARLEKGTGTRPRTVTRYADVLANPDVDAVVIATPDFAHSPILADAAKAGKHAYVEKPMSISIEQASAAVQAVQRNGIVVQVGTQKRSETLHQQAAQRIQAGFLGEVLKVECNWWDHRPRWKRDYSNVKAEDVDWKQYLMDLPDEPFDARRFRCWHLYKSFTNGPTGLLGSHLFDVTAWYLNTPYPDWAMGMGHRRVWKEREHQDTQDCLMAYGDVHVQWSLRLANKHGVAQNMFYGTRGTFDTTSWTFNGKDGSVDPIAGPVKLEEKPGTDHFENWIDCIRRGDRKPRADVAAGYSHSVASILSGRACNTGHPVRMIQSSGAVQLVEDKQWDKVGFGGG